MDLFSSLIPRSNQQQTIPYPSLYITNPPIQNNTYSGIATIISLLSSVIGTLNHRDKSVCTRPELLNEELEHLMEALIMYNYPGWAIQKVQNKYINSNWEENGNNNNNQENPTQDTTVKVTALKKGKNKCRPHSHPIHQRTARQHQDLWKIWYPDTFQGE